MKEGKEKNNIKINPPDKRTSPPPPPAKVEYTDYTPDLIVQTIVENFVKRAEMGEKKYGVTLDREDLSIEDFIEHALQEHMDAILYLQKVKTMLEKQKNGK